ncbi:MAG TPA: GGDEF domain-containing protein [Rubrivivax sp.]|nr:GGDEF domain-containing protein [Rubrivivax sp.]
MIPTLQVLWVGPSMPGLAADPYGPFELRACASLDDAAQMLREARFDAVVLPAADAAAAQALCRWTALSQALLDAAVLVEGPALDVELALRLIDLGAQDVLGEAPGGRALRLAVQRKQLERAARKAYATDLSTGLPNHAQLLEHMTHLLALREREPAPMALLVLRIEGLGAASATLGPEAANVLRRKAAVRLRAGLRASDVVAAIGADSFAVLLAWIDASSAAAHVADKLARSLRQPIGVAGREQRLAVAVGVADYPLHGRAAEELLRVALGQCAAAHATTLGGGSARAGAANDE